MIYPDSPISLDKLFGTPPFETPNIVKALMNFNMYKFGHESSVSVLFNFFFLLNAYLFNIKYLNFK